MENRETGKREHRERFHNFFGYLMDEEFLAQLRNDESEETGEDAGEDASQDASVGVDEIADGVAGTVLGDPVDTNRDSDDSLHDAESEQVAAAVTPSGKSNEGGISESDLMYNNGVIRESVAGIIGGKLKERCMVDAPYQEHEKRLIGQMAYKGFETTEVLTLPSFPHFPSVSIVRIPREQQASSKKNRRRLQRQRKAKAKKWMGHLPHNFNEALMASYFEEHPEQARELIKKTNKYLFQMTPVETLAMQTWCKVTDTQVYKIGRCVEYFAGGLRITASKDSCIELKRNYIADELSTLTHRKVKLEKVVSVGKKKNKLTREVPITVTECRPFEILERTIHNDFRRNKYIPAEKRYTEPWSMDSEFAGSILEKFAIDSGNGSTKAIMSSVNVANPQSQEHVSIVMEYSGVKDSAVNVDRATFDENGLAGADMEAILNRRVILLKITVRDQMQVVVVENIEEGHDPYAPKPLPKKFTGYTDRTPLQPTPPPPKTDAEKLARFNERVARVDVPTVKSLSLMRNTVTQEIDGIAFIGQNGNVIAQALFHTPFAGKQGRGGRTKLKQFVVGGVFTADLEFLSRFLGHQGAGAKYLCMFCLAIKGELWGGGAFEQRTMESLEKDGKLYKELMTAIPESKRLKERPKITKGQTNSMISPPMVRMPMEAATKAPMHVILGIVPWIIKATKKAYRRVEKLEAESQGDSNIAPQLRQNVEWAINTLLAYEEYLAAELEGLISSVAGHEKLMAKLASQIEYADRMHAVHVQNQELDIAAQWEAKKQALVAEHSATINAMLAFDEEEAKEHEAQFMEQLFIANQRRTEFQDILSKHEGHADRVIDSCLSSNGIDQAIYFSGVVDGNQCMKYGENHKAIMEDVESEMKGVIKSTENVAHIEALGELFRGLLKPWYRLMQVMKSVRKQSTAEIRQFKQDTNEFKAAIERLSKENPVPGLSIALPSFLKSHLLFDGHLQDQLETWGTLGGLDEQSIESTHPIFNQLLRRYGNSRGAHLKRQVIRQFMFERASFVLDVKDKMVEDTSNRKKRPNTKKRGNKKGDAMETKEPVDVSFELSEMESKMNANDDLHPTAETAPEDEVLDQRLSKLTYNDTCISACAKCGKRIFGFMKDIHDYEAHSGSIFGDVDDEVAAKVTLEAAA